LDNKQIYKDSFFASRGIHAKTFIAGRALAADDGRKMAEALKAEVDKYWPDKNA
jgi:3-keto-L-gulonate-6-phosphate decarboxylase